MKIREVGRLLRTGKISCVELVETCLAEIDSKDAQYNSFLTVTAEQAMETAIERDKELAAGIDRGAFHGIPVAHKDLVYTRGVRTTSGSLIYKDFVPNHNATVVDRLAVGGAVLLGKTGMHELAFGVTSNNPHYGAVHNPHDLEKIPGGSSGGSGAAVALKFVAMATGTDTGGSIRIPASYCGVVGLMPTYGRVSRFGVFPLAFSLDHVGPIASCVEDCALTMNEIAGYDLRDAASSSQPVPDFNLPPLRKLEGVRVGIPTSFYFERLDSEVEAAVKRAIRQAESLGAEIVDLAVPDIAEMTAASRIILWAEAAAVHVNHRDPKQFGEDLWALMEQGRMVSGVDYVNAQRLRSIYRTQFDAIWQEVDVIATPTTPVVAPAIGQKEVEINGQKEDVRLASTRLVRAINLLGEPALSMPCGKSKGGLPIGLQLIAAPFAEPKLLQIARTLEEALT